MKILHIVPSYYPAVQLGGPVQSVHNLNKTLVKKGCQVDVLTLNAGLENRKELSNNKWIVIDNVRIRYFKYLRLGAFAFSFSFLLMLLRIIRQYDVIHITGIWNFPIIAGAAVSLVFKKPYIISPRGALFREAVEFKKKIIKYFYFNFFLKPFLKKSFLHFTSLLEMENTFNYLGFKTNYCIVYNGLDIEKINKVIEKIKNSNRPYKNKYLIFLGRITPIKGLEKLINAFQALCESHQNIDLVLAGPDVEGYSKKIISLIKKLNIDNKIFFSGLLNFEEKIKFLYFAEALILPSYSENFGNVVTEALACKTPVIISSMVGIAREIFSVKAGIIVNPIENILSSEIEKLLNDTNLRNEIITNGFYFVSQNFDIHIIAEKMISFYKILLKG